LEKGMPKLTARKSSERQWVSYVFISPKVILLGIFFFFCLGFALYISLTEWSLFTAPHFVGLNNYKKLLSDDIFIKSVTNTVIYVCVRVPLVVFVSLSLSLLVNEKILGRNIFRTIYFIPVISSMVVAAVIWVYLYSTQFGLINFFLRKLGLPPQEWLSSPSLALFSIIIMTVWKDAGYYMIIFLAGLQGIPHIYYEAAIIDGAGRWGRFWYITLPLLKPTFFIVCVICTIVSFQFFATPYIMTRGGPVYSTMSLSLYLYNQGFTYYKMGYASAIGFVLFVIIFCFSIVEKKFFKET